MVMSSKTILDLAGGQGRGVERGAVLFHRRSDQRGFSVSDKTPAQRQFLADLEARDVPAPIGVKHPANVARVVRPSDSRENGKGGRSLTASELAWLNRFPSPVDPTQVSFEDAQVLASLAASISRVSNPGDARLVESIWAPVREFHDEHEAQAMLDDARRPLPIIPSSIAGALHDAISAEVPALAPHEVVGRASEMLADLHDRRRKEQAERLAEAEKRMAGVKDATHARTRVTQ